MWLEEKSKGNYDSLRIKYATAQLTPVNIEISPKESGQSTITDALSLKCYPNPFNNITTIVYQIPSKGQVFLSVYDIAGRKLQDLVSHIQPAGSYRFELSSHNLPTGLYFIQLNFNQRLVTIKALVIK